MPALAITGRLRKAMPMLNVCAFVVMILMRRSETRMHLWGSHVTDRATYC